MIFSKAKNLLNILFRQLNVISEENQKIFEESNTIKLLLAKTLAAEIQKSGIVENLKEIEYKVFSQFGDDGIIQYLIHNTKLKCNTFIEFGVENYTESNTRLLLLNNWKGLVIDGSLKNIENIKKQSIYWRTDLTAVHSFVTKENINQLFIDNNYTGEIGILSIDIDGNDYWIWETIVSVNPIIVVIEYNSVFGDELPISIPYDKEFNRIQAHYSHLYWGASIAALCHLATQKGYFFVGCNSAGNNAYFVRKDYIGDLKKLTPKQGYIESRFRDSRDKNGKLNFLSGKERLKEISNCSVIDIITNNVNILEELL